MNDQETKEEMQRMFKAFPSLGDYYARHRETLRDVWSGQLRSVERTDAAKIINRMIAGEIEVPPNYEFDRTCIQIKQHAAVLARKRESKISSDRLRNEINDARTRESCGSDEYKRFCVAWRLVIANSNAKKRGDVSEEEHAAKFRIIRAWYLEGGDFPAELEIVA